MKEKGRKKYVDRTETIQEDKVLKVETEEIWRLSKYVEGDQSPTKIRFSSRAAAEETIGKAGKLARVEEQGKESHYNLTKKRSKFFKNENRSEIEKGF